MLVLATVNKYHGDNVHSSLSNNMLYPKEDKENRILLYAVSIWSETSRSFVSMRRGKTHIDTVFNRF